MTIGKRSATPTSQQKRSQRGTKPPYSQRSLFATIKPGVTAGQHVLEVCRLFDLMPRDFRDFRTPPPHRLQLALDPSAIPAPHNIVCNFQDTPSLDCNDSAKMPIALISRHARLRPIIYAGFKDCRWIQLRGQ